MNLKYITRLYWSFRGYKALGKFLHASHKKVKWEEMTENDLNYDEDIVNFYNDFPHKWYEHDPIPTMKTSKLYSQGLSYPTTYTKLIHS